jgi:hypothetical protein
MGKTRQAGKCRTRSSGISVLGDRALFDELPSLSFDFVGDVDALSRSDASRASQHRDNQRSAGDVAMLKRGTNATGARVAWIDEQTSTTSEQCRCL